MTENHGIVKVPRYLFKTSYFQNRKEKTKFEALLDIYNMAGYTNREVYFNGHKFILRPNEFVTSNPALAKRWGWQVSKVQRFLTKLQIDKIIHRTETNKGSVILVFS